MTNLDELDEAIAAGADMILLDNFVLAARRRRRRGCRQPSTARTGCVVLEASGGVTLANLPAIARTGVDYVSLGALTHSAGSLDFSLEVVL